MRRHAIVVALGVILLAESMVPADALEARRLRESEGIAPAGAPPPCALAPSLNGSCANYRWHNVCGGYIWIYQFGAAGEGAGVKFGGASQPCVSPGNRAKRGIYYFRNIVPNYGQLVDLFIDGDCNNDGCPEANLGSSLGFDPGLRWNCVNYGVCIPCNGIILRQLHRGGVSPTFATDGPFKSGCDPSHPPTHSYYYGINGSTCVPWLGVQSTAPDDFLMWLVVDSDATCANATHPTSWGAIKGLYQ